MNPFSARLTVDPLEYDFGDASGTVRTTPRRWRWITAGAEDVPGAALVAMEAISDVLGAAGGSGTSLDELSDPVWRRLNELSAVHGPRTKIVDVLGPHDPLVIATEECDLMLSAAARSVAGEFGISGQGSVAAIHVSDGGAPKTPVGAVEMGPRGPVGDRQAERAHHGRPFQAVSLYSLEAIEALVAEGHPIAPGAVGENLLLTGIDWETVRPGLRLVITPREAEITGSAALGSTRTGKSEIGSDGSRSGRVATVADAAMAGASSAVVLEVNAWAPPCKTIADAFIDRRFDRIDPDRFPGWARAYAWVISGGTVTRGANVRLLN